MLRDHAGRAADRGLLDGPGQGHPLLAVPQQRSH